MKACSRTRCVARAAPQSAPTPCRGALNMVVCVMACVPFVVHSVFNPAPFGIACSLEASKVLYEVMVNIFDSFCAVLTVSRFNVKDVRH